MSTLRPIRPATARINGSSHASTHPSQPPPAHVNYATAPPPRGYPPQQRHGSLTPPDPLSPASTSTTLQPLTTRRARALNTALADNDSGRYLSSSPSPSLSPGATPPISGRLKRSPTDQHRTLTNSSSAPSFTPHDDDTDNARGLSKQAATGHALPVFSSLYRTSAVLSAVKYIVLILVVLFALRYGLHAYLDRSKASTYTIVAVVRDLSYVSAENDRMRHAFEYTALMSWSELVVGRNIVVFGDTSDTCEYVQDVVRDVRCVVISEWHEESHRPLLSGIMTALPSLVSTDTVVYVNGDYVVHSSLTAAISTVQAKYTRYLAVGSHVAVEAQMGLLDHYTSSDFIPSLFAHAASTGTRSPTQTHSADLFVFPLALLSSPPFSPFPPFLAGVYRWDQWFVSACILDDSISVLDLSTSVPLVQQHKTQPSPPSKQGTAYNDQLVKSLSGNAYKIGYTENAELVLVGTCPACEVVVNVNITDVVLFTKRASKEGYLVVLTVNSGYTNLALNWVCWAKRIHFHNYILLAEDQRSASKFRSHGCPVIVQHDAPTEKPAADYGSVEFQETMTFRTEFLMSVLQAGFHFVTADMDGLWLDDPIQYFNHNVDLQGQTHKETKISGGFVVVRATSYGRYFWQQVIECQRKNAKFLSTAKPGTYEPASYTEQYCVNELSHGLSSQPLFSKGLLDPYIFPDGKSFFDETNSQFRGVMPAVIHNNWIKGTNPKLQRLHDWQLHSADEEKEVCLDIPQLPPPQLSGRRWRLKVRVLAGRSASLLLQCLTGLAKAEYGGDSVAVEVDLDQQAAGDEWSELRRVAKEFAWPHGAYTVVERDGAPVGKMKQWLAWRADEDDEVVVMVEENVQLAGSWYEVARLLLDRYYTEGGEYDHRTYGIALTRPNVIIGETYEQRWGQKVPRDLTPPSPLSNTDAVAGTGFSAASATPSLLYKYQLLPQSAVLMFPKHWRSFLGWLDTAQLDKSSVPCTPTLISNTWYVQDKDTHWAAWFHRYVFEQGWYALYSNLNSTTVLALPTTSDYAIDLLPTQPPSAQLADNITAAYAAALSALAVSSVSGGSGVAGGVPVYDFHFKLVNVVDTLSWRQYLTPPQHFPEQCWVMARMEVKLKEDAERVERERVDKVKLAMAKQKEAEAERKRKADEEAAKKKAAAATAPAKPAVNAPAVAAASPAAPKPVVPAQAAPAKAAAAPAATPVKAAPPAAPLPAAAKQG